MDEDEKSDNQDLSSVASTPDIFRAPERRRSFTHMGIMALKRLNIFNNNESIIKPKSGSKMIPSVRSKCSGNSHASSINRSTADSAVDQCRKLK